MSLDELESMIFNMMNLSSSDDEDASYTEVVKKLVARVHQRTQGNPYYAIQYMHAFWESQVADNAECKWNNLLARLDAYQLATPTGNGVLDVILEKYQQLPKAVIRYVS